MKLENLYTDFLSLTPPLQEVFLFEYFTRRQQDLLNPVRFVKRTPRKASAEQLKFTDEEKALMKVLGLKQRDLIKLRESMPSEIDEADQDEDELEVE